MSDVTQILHAIERGEQSAECLLPLVYEELRRLAAAWMGNEAANTLQPTALVHEAGLRLAGNDASIPFANRAHFFAAAAEAMRRILIDRARRKSSEKRGRNWERIDFEKVDIAASVDDETLLLVNDALEKFQEEDPQSAELVRLRFFGGLTLADAGKVLSLPERTAKRRWAYARAWLYDELRRGFA
jgi:RNA polymerase sigma factor (TIGR02999 family)